MLTVCDAFCFIRASAYSLTVTKVFVPGVVQASNVSAAKALLILFLAIITIRRRPALKLSHAPSPVRLYLSDPVTVTCARNMKLLIDPSPLDISIIVASNHAQM